MAELADPVEPDSAEASSPVTPEIDTAPTRKSRGKQVKHSLLRRVLGWVFTVVGLAFVLVYGAAFLVPTLMGGQGLTILTGSMRPTLEPGDVVAVRHVSPEDACRVIGMDDVITFMPRPDDPSLITHRVVGVRFGNFDGYGCEFMTRGDANTADDAPVHPRQVRARVMYSVPRVGWVWQWAMAHRPLILGVIGGAVAVWILSDPVMDALSRRHSRQRGMRDRSQ